MSGKRKRTEENLRACGWHKVGDALKHELARSVILMFRNGDCAAFSRAWFAVAREQGFDQSHTLMALARGAAFEWFALAVEGYGFDDKAASVGAVCSALLYAKHLGGWHD